MAGDVTRNEDAEEWAGEGGGGENRIEGKRKN